MRNGQASLLSWKKKRHQKKASHQSAAWKNVLTRIPSCWQPDLSSSHIQDYRKMNCCFSTFSLRCFAMAVCMSKTPLHQNNTATSGWNVLTAAHQTFLAPCWLCEWYRLLLHIWGTNFSHVRKRWVSATGKKDRSCILNLLFLPLKQCFNPFHLFAGNIF